MYQEVLRGSEARNKILKGINTVAEPIAATIGPKGRNAVISRGSSSPLITNDGVTIARAFGKLKDDYENDGAQMVKGVSIRSNEVGDGTTTSTVLAAAMANEANKLLASGVDPIVLKEGIERAYEKAKKKLEKMSLPVSDMKRLVQVATISVEDDVTGEIIGKMMHDVGEDGAITVETSRDVKFESKITEGIKFEQGFISWHFMTNPIRQETVVDNAPILVTNHVLESWEDQMLPVTEHLVQKGIKSLTLICDDIKGDALVGAIQNIQAGEFLYNIIRLPGLDEARTDNGRDIAIAVGAEFIDKNVAPFSSITLPQMGYAKRVITKPYETIIVNANGKKKEIAKRIKELKKEKEISIYPEDRDKLKERIARLSQGIGVIRVGSATELELNYKKLKIEDALAATRAAQEEGIVPGGGIALLNLYEKSDHPGEKVFYESLKEPFRRIAENAGKNAGALEEKVLTLPLGEGWDAKNDKYVDMLESGIIDPVKVTKAALQNSTSMALMFISMDSHIVGIEEDSDKQTPPQGRQQR